MSMNSRRLIWLGLLTLVFLCVQAPAQLLGSVLGQFTQHRLGLAASSGSLWAGSANLLLFSADSHDSPLDLGRVSWNTQPLQLMAGRFEVNLVWNGGAPFWITQDTTRLKVEHAVFNLPAEILPSLVPALKAAQLGGQLAVRCDNFSLTRHEILGQLDIDWREATSPLGMISPLGNYHVLIDGHGSVLDLVLETQAESPLILQGKGHWSGSEGLHFEGNADTSPAARDKLQELLRVMGNETAPGSGRYQMRF